MKLAFVGKAGTGKTSLAMLLVNNHGFVKLSFAYFVKRFAREILQRPIDKKVDRRFLQALGNGARLSDPLVWIRRVAITIQELEEQGIDRIVIDDCRYENEAKFLKSVGFTLIKLSGKSFIKMPKGSEKHVSELESEKIKCDISIDSSQTIASMYQELRKKLSDKNSGNLKDNLRMYTMRRKKGVI